ncbi:MAG: helix-turn-helix transcriptional regulator [Ruminococcaceae bacterium]|nr:helix-turn-helix transcriptional regulator [Oscillospiraceae bacterium]
MYVYKIKLPSQIPSTVWACKTTVTNYKWKSANKNNMIELSLSHASSRRAYVEGLGNFELNGTCFGCSVGEENKTSEADAGIAVDILTIALKFESIEGELCKLDSDTPLPDCSVLLVPLYDTDLPEQDLCELESLFYRYIHCYMEHSASADAMCASIIFELFSRLDSITRKNLKTRRGTHGTKLSSKDKYVNYYVSKAESIMKRRYAEKITLNQTANELGITPSYLSTVFRESTGKCFSDRLLQIRMEKAKELILEGKLSVKQISESIGFDDESHFRKRFKHYFGASIREYVCINKEQTLYHKKPTF